MDLILPMQEVYVVDIALAQIGVRTDAVTVDKLLALAADAERRGFIPWALEARLAAWRLLQTQGAAGIRQNTKAAAATPSRGLRF
jgi:hypothetical protein